jgi:hypothetical protein
MGAVGRAGSAGRRERVAAGVAELDHWLTDQVRQGLATAIRSGYGHWDAMAARLVDAQAPGLASAVRRLAGSAGAPERLLADLGLIRLLVAGYQRCDELPADLAATVRGRVGFPVASADVLAGRRHRDRWEVLGRRDDGDERLTVRRVWLRGRVTGRPALVLAFAPVGQALPDDLLPGTCLDADLAFYPGALPMRALVAQRYDNPVPFATPAHGEAVAAALAGHARAVAAEPWLERWPVLLVGVTPTTDYSGQWYLRDGAGDALPVEGTPWRLVAAAGGAPVSVAGELTPAGVRPLTAWVDERLVTL